MKVNHLTPVSIDHIYITRVVLDDHGQEKVLTTINVEHFNKNVMVRKNRYVKMEDKVR